MSKPHGFGVVLSNAISVSTALSVLIAVAIPLAAIQANAATRDYAVEVSATVQESPPRIDFSWVADPSATEYRIFRKSVEDTVWTGPIAILDGSATSFSDGDVAIGQAFEYSFRKSPRFILDTVAVTSGDSLTFTIHDSWGDGICCAQGLGSYKVTGCGAVYGSGGDFGSSESISFVVGTLEHPCDELVVEIILDVFGAETRWELTRADIGDTVAHGGPYTSPKFGHIFAGIRYPLPDDWGTVLLLVDGAVADSLATELERLELDMIRDGYRVRRHEVAHGTSVPEVKSLIAGECQSDPTITTLLLLGNIAVPYSGDIRGAHTDHWGAWPADVYYGELDGPWTDSTVYNTSAERSENHNVPGDGKFDQTFLPSDVDLQVGRVDLSRQPLFAEDEIELLRRYLDKNHTYRNGELYIPRRGRIKDNCGELLGVAYACNAWRNFTAMFGSASVTTGAWIPDLQADPFLWAFGCGPGGYTSCSMVVTTNDFANKTFYAVFTMLMGSYFGDWDNSSNLLRAALGSDGYILTSLWGGKPTWHFHHMALGYPIGYGVRLSQNNHIMYMAAYGGRQIHAALMGDPTLRLHPVKSPCNLSLEEVPPGIGLTWSAPEDSILGYNVYRSESMNEGFTRLNPTLIEDTTYVDAAPVCGRPLYMVRAVRLETTASGTYLNLSPGAIDSIDVSAGALPPSGDILLGSFPNPSSTSTRINFNLGSAGNVTLKIYDTTGRLVRTIDAGPQDAGRHTLAWDGEDAGGRRVAGGVYFLNLITGTGTISAKVVRVE